MMRNYIKVCEILSLPYNDEQVLKIFLKADNETLYVSEVEFYKKFLEILDYCPKENQSKWLSHNLFDCNLPCEKCRERIAKVIKEEKSKVNVVINVW